MKQWPESHVASPISGPSQDPEHEDRSLALRPCSARIQSRRRGLPGVLRRLLRRATRRSSSSPFDLTVGEFPEDLDACDAWITTGSRHSVYDDVPWIVRLAELVRALDRERRKLVGICFGAQMIGHALGGEVARAPSGWQVGLKEVRIVTIEPWMSPPADTFRILHSNGDQILTPPDSAAGAGVERRGPGLGSGSGGPLHRFPGPSGVRCRPIGGVDGGQTRRP